jgi:hypothetical protein
LWTAAAVGALILGTTAGALAQQADTSVSGSAVGLDAKMSAVLDSLKASGVPTQANNNNPPAGQVSSQFGEAHPVQIGNQTVRVGGPLAESIEAANARAALAVGQAGLNAEFAQGQAGLQAQQAIGQAGLNAQAAQAQQRAAFAAGQPAVTAQAPTQQPTVNGQVVGTVHELRIGNQTFRLGGPLEEAMQEANQRAAFEAGQAGLNAQFAMGQAGLRALQQTGELGLSAQAAQAAAQQRAAAAGQASPAPNSAAGQTSTSSQFGDMHPVRIGNDTFRIGGPLAEKIQEQEAKAAFAVGQAGLNAEFQNGQTALRAEQRIGQAGISAQMAQASAAQKAAFAVGQAGLAAPAAPAPSADRSSTNGDRVSHGAPRNTGATTVR